MYFIIVVPPFRMCERVCVCVRVMTYEFITLAQHQEKGPAKKDPFRNNGTVAATSPTPHARV